MSTLIHFYMSEVDEANFIDYLRGTGDIAILPQASRVKLTEEFDSFSALKGRELGDGCHLWNRAISPVPIFMHYPEQNFYWLDCTRSDVINPRRSLASDNTLGQGKLAICDQYDCMSIARIDKSPELIQWFRQICARIKKGSVRKVEGAFTFPDAAKLFDAGGHQWTFTFRGMKTCQLPFLEHRQERIVQSTE